MEQLEVDGVALELRRISGPTGKASVVFLHEGLGCASLWTQRDLDWPLALCSATGRPGLVYSRRGYGRSAAARRTSPGDTRPAPLGPDYLHHEAWSVLPRLLAQLDIHQPVLLGHSDGASIALLHASRFAVTACVAMAPHVMVEDVAIAAITGAKAAFESGELRQRLARHHADVDGAFWQWNDVWLSQAFRSFDIRRECQAIAAPLLLVQGLSDEYGTMRQLHEIAMAAPHARQLRLADCGHSPQRDRPTDTLEAIAAFLHDQA